MPVYFASDVHLRLDRPERARRLARWVNRLEPVDTLTIVGDLCDFWFAARQLGADSVARCEGLRALAAFRSRGGALTILPGNHDTWLGPFYREALGADFIRGPMETVVHGLRLFVDHGHLLGARPVWKGWMESRGFLVAFRHLPAPLAQGLDRMLEWTNERGRAANDRRLLASFRRLVRQHAEADIVVLGHLHDTIDEATSQSRLVVLGDWRRQSSYLKVDASGASLIVEADSASIPCETPR